MKILSPAFFLILLVGLLLTSNSHIFLQALQNEWLYYTPSLKYASAFSAYYNAAWALIHNPASVYDNHIFPVAHAQDFRYPPWFLLFILPFLSLSFPNAQFGFDILQFLLLPAIALLIILIIRPKTKLEYLISAIVLISALIEPLVRTTIMIDSSGGAYYQQYWQGESKVLELFLILASLYFAKKGSWVAPVLVVIGAIDPRFTLMALPLFLYFFFKAGSFFKFMFGTFLSILIVLPFVFYHNVLGQFLTFHQYKLLTFYAYEWILFYPILTLSIAILLIDVNKQYGIKKRVISRVRFNLAPIRAHEQEPYRAA